jgi:hypothetical protein
VELLSVSSLRVAISRYLPSIVIGPAACRISFSTLMDSNLVQSMMMNSHSYVTYYLITNTYRTPGPVTRIFFIFSNTSF